MVCASLGLGLRIIPAYAGSTWRRTGRLRRSRDHPRIRGEHSRPPPGSSWSGGSSPHTRGAPEPSSTKSLSWRIIPAYAGSTRSGCGTRFSDRDHPRIRGEHDRGRLPRHHQHGSSPHTRGAHADDGPVLGEERIIPAYAGSTGAFPRRAQRSPDHPRIRGEHSLACGASTKGTGSSPHTRGAPVGFGAQLRDRRIIPAYAGSTSARTGPSWRRADHPRIRGEHRRGRHGHIRVARIIPAYAGSTLPARGRPDSCADHPRIRGEHPRRRAKAILTCRIIPAYAGSTRLPST